MNQLNSVIIEGNLVKDAQVKETTKGNQLSTFSIAVNRSIKNSNGEIMKEVSYFDIETWGKAAEICKRKGKKGNSIRVVGRLKQNRWEGTDGKSYSRICIIADHLEFTREAKHNQEENAASSGEIHEKDMALEETTGEMVVF